MALTKKDVVKIREWAKQSDTFDPQWVVDVCTEWLAQRDEIARLRKALVEYDTVGRMERAIDSGGRDPGNPWNPSVALSRGSSTDG